MAHACVSAGHLEVLCLDRLARSRNPALRCHELQIHLIVGQCWELFDVHVETLF